MYPHSCNEGEKMFGTRSNDARLGNTPQLMREGGVPQARRQPRADTRCDVFPKMPCGGGDGTPSSCDHEVCGLAEIIERSAW